MVSNFSTSHTLRTIPKILNTPLKGNTLHQLHQDLESINIGEII